MVFLAGEGGRGVFSQFTFYGGSSVVEVHKYHYWHLAVQACFYCHMVRVVDCCC